MLDESTLLRDRLDFFCNNSLSIDQQNILIALQLMYVMEIIEILLPIVELIDLNWMNNIHFGEWRRNIS